MKEARERRHGLQLAFNSLYINEKPYKLKQLRETEALPNFGTNERKRKG